MMWPYVYSSFPLAGPVGEVHADVAGDADAPPSLIVTVEGHAGDGADVLRCAVTGERLERRLVFGLGTHQRERYRSGAAHRNRDSAVKRERDVYTWHVASV